MKQRLIVALVVSLGAACAPMLFVRGSTAAPAVDGKAIFAARCATCHQATGLGGGPYPPLAGNPDVTAADTSNIILNVLNGRSGPIQVNGKTFSATMPAWKDQLTNDEIAAVLTYVRSAWNNSAPSVGADQVAAQRNPTTLSGAQIFAAKCATCHQPRGQGTSAFPPLDANPHVNANDPREMIATIVNGRSGALTVNGTAYNGAMPAWKGQLSNADIAAVATYVRSAWTNKASGVTEQQVASSGTPVLNTVGQSIYASKCAACHGKSGQGGGGGTFPALAGNGTVKGDAGKLIAIISHGKSMMPAWKGQLSPSDIAAVATYIRAAWGNNGSPVSEADVAAVK